jgi:DNA-binding transcriptional LysR family regulator
MSTEMERLTRTRTMPVRRDGPRANAAYEVDKRLLRNFLSVIECKSFTTAAAALKLTQPALTKSIKTLERIIGVTLLDRQHGSVVPTRYGEALATRAKLMELELAHALSEIEALRGGFTGVVKVGVGPSFIGYIADVVLALQLHRPNLMVNVTVDIMDSLLAGLIGGTFDVICTSLEFASFPDIEKLQLLEGDNFVIASPAHPLASRNVVEPKELLVYPWVAFSKDNMGTSRMGAVFAANRLRPPAIRTTANSAEFMFDLLMKSNYLASIPSLLMPVASAAGLVRLPIHGPFWRVMIGIAYRKTTCPSIAVNEFISVCKTLFLPKNS